MDKKKAEFGLTDDDVKSVRSEFFAAVFSIAKDDKQVTEDKKKS